MPCSRDPINSVLLFAPNVSLAHLLRKIPNFIGQADLDAVGYSQLNPLNHPIYWSYQGGLTPYTQRSLARLSCLRARQMFGSVAGVRIGVAQNVIINCFGDGVGASLCALSHPSHLWPVQFRSLARDLFSFTLLNASVVPVPASAVFLPSERSTCACFCTCSAPSGGTGRCLASLWLRMLPSLSWGRRERTACTWSCSRASLCRCPPSISKSRRPSRWDFRGRDYY